MRLRDLGITPEPSRCKSCFAGVTITQGGLVQACLHCGIHAGDEAAVALVLMLLAYAEREGREPPVH